MFFVAGDAGPEGLRREPGAMPIPAAFGRPVQPNLTDAALAQGFSRLGVDDADQVPLNGFAAAHHWGLVAVFGQGLFHPRDIFLQRALVQSQDLAPTEGHDQCVLGHAVSALQGIRP